MAHVLINSLEIPLSIYDLKGNNSVGGCHVTSRRRLTSFNEPRETNILWEMFTDFIKYPQRQNYNILVPKL